MVNKGKKNQWGGVDITTAKGMVRTIREDEMLTVRRLDNNGNHLWACHFDTHAERAVSAYDFALTVALKEIS